MGPFVAMPDLTGSAPKDLLEEGVLARGIIVSIQQTSVRTGAGRDASYVCVFTLEVAPDDLPRFTATCRQAVRATILPELTMPGATVPVRVDCRDRRRVALSLNEQLPTVTVADARDGVPSSADRGAGRQIRPQPEVAGKRFLDRLTGAFDRNVRVADQRPDPEPV